MHLLFQKIDCAMIVEKPYLSEVEEPAACLGLWRLDKIDMAKTAMAPVKDEKELLNEVSVLLGQEQASAIKALLEKEGADLETAKEG